MSLDHRVSRLMLILMLVWGISSQAADIIVPVAQVLSHPSAFHRHAIVLSGKLKLIGQWKGKDILGRLTCSPLFTLQDDTGEMPVFYVILCDQKEIDKISALSGDHVIVHATIESQTVMNTPDGSEFRIRAMATRIQREDK